MNELTLKIENLKMNFMDFVRMIEEDNLTSDEVKEIMNEAYSQVLEAMKSLTYNLSLYSTDKELAYFILGEEYEGTELLFKDISESNQDIKAEEYLKILEDFILFLGEYENKKVFEEIIAFTIKSLILGSILVKDYDFELYSAGVEFIKSKYPKYFKKEKNGRT